MTISENFGHSEISSIGLWSQVDGLIHLYKGLTIEGGGYGFLFRSEFFFRTTQELEYLIFWSNLTLGYMTKTLNQIFFFSLHQNQNIFFSNIGNQNIFLEIKHNPPPPPLQVKWSFPKAWTILINSCLIYLY